MFGSKEGRKSEYKELRGKVGEKIRKVTKDERKLEERLGRKRGKKERRVSGKNRGKMRKYKEINEKRKKKLN